MNRAVVTGGCGFIGSHVVDRLLALGVRVLVVDDLSTGRIENIESKLEDSEQARLEFAEGQIQNGGTLLEIIRFKPDVIFHLAAQADVQTSIRYPVDDADANIIGTLKLCLYAKDIDAKVVFASSGGAVYGNRPEGAARETAPVSPRSPYAVSKLAAESYVRLFGAQNVVLRYANVYGPRQLATAEGGVVAIFAKALRERSEALREKSELVIYGDGLQTRDFVYVDDVVDATVRVGARGGSAGVLNVGTGLETPIIELLRTMAGREVTDGVTFAPEREGDLRYSSVDPTRLKAMYDWEARSLEDGLAELVKA